MSDRLKGLVFFFTVLMSPLMAGMMLIAVAVTHYDMSIWWSVPYTVIWLVIWDAMIRADWHMHF